jgi:type IV secretion system protein VirB10
VSDKKIESLPGERGVSLVGGNRPRWRRGQILTIGLITVAGFVLWTIAHGPVTKQKPPEKPVTISQLNEWKPAKIIHASMPTLPPPPMPPPPMVAPPMPLPSPAQNTVLAPGDPLAKARAASLLDPKELQGTQQARPPTAAAPQPAAASAADPPGSLAGQLRPTVLAGTSATVLRHPDMTITEATLIPCILNTAIDSSAPGFVTCTTEEDSFGTTATVNLLPRGTKIFGEYRNEMRPGQDRIFVAWDRAETPDHVLINLGSPGADGLGRSGFDGRVNNHWWARFGAALLFTLIDSGANAASAIFAQGGSTYLNFGTGQGVANTALQNQINVPPTIYKNQGEQVAIMVGRDLDFSGVYSLQLRH